MYAACTSMMCGCGYENENNQFHIASAQFFNFGK